MKNHAKVGNRNGRPAYRTPSSFKYRSHLKNQQAKRAVNNVNKWKIY